MTLTLRSKDLVWGPKARLILRNARVDAVQASEAAWRLSDDEKVLTGNWLPTDLTGFQYQRFGGLDADQLKTMADAKPQWYVDWLAAQRHGNLPHDSRYDPQPYEQLAQVLTAAGREDTARAIRYAKYRHRDRAAPVPWWRDLLRSASRWIIGNGVYPFWALGWFAGVVAVGGLVVSRSPEPRLAPWYSKFWYSLENALPLVQLSAEHAEISHDNDWIVSWFHFQKLAGFLLATLFLGGLTLLSG